MVNLRVVRTHQLITSISCPPVESFSWPNSQWTFIFYSSAKILLHYNHYTLLFALYYARGARVAAHKQGLGSLRGISAVLYCNRSIHSSFAFNMQNDDNDIQTSRSADICVFIHKVGIPSVGQSFITHRFDF